ncbi:DUF7527 domain-containing protein [Salinigranum marinum]|uniref:DUF7527 domain-containing protein n=1 Tax=Salinigranum marinum TaxID=1515595 RepID=UPI002989D231|nr:hypothetical protein [Salinigranum marinum]
MDPEITGTVTGWESVTAGSGYAGLRSLAADDFSGAVTAGLAWAFFLNGRIVGVFDGDIEEFADADLTAYRALEPALALLFAMRETGGETRGQYYTEKTPLEEVDRTLSAGNFTGYVELSENVLSGDYYVVYHGGRSMSVAYVGASERLVTDEEAFELAADEVGIYDVNAVDITVVDIPGESADEAAADRDSSVDRDGAMTDEDGATAGVGAEAGGSLETTDGDDGDDPPADEPAATGAVTFGDRGDADETGTTEAHTDADADGDDENQYDSGPSLRAASSADFGLGGDTEPQDGDDIRPPTGEARAEAGAESDGSDGAADEGREIGPADERESDPDDSGGEEPRDTAEPDGVDERRRTDDTETFGEGDDTETFGDAVTGTGPEAANGAGRSSVDEGDGATVADEPRMARLDDTGDDAEADTDAEVGVDAAPTEPTNATESTDPTDAAAAEGAFSAERQWQETRRIPALDPDESMPPAGRPAETEGAAERQGPRAHESEGSEASVEEPEQPPGGGPEAVEAGADPEPTDAPESGPAGAIADAPDADRHSLREKLAATESERDELAARVDTLQSRLEAVTRERDEHRSRIDDLESEIERLREAVDRAGAEGDDAGAERLSPAAAREGTNLFVRYRSKGKPTLETARAGEARQDAVVENLRIEYHTTFENESATVDGEPYETFLYGTTEWGFVRWVVEELLYEIGRSGHRADLSALFDRIPEIDRVQFDGEVSVTVEGDGGESHEARTFDLVFRDSMGDPLFVANLNTERNATTAGAVGSLVEGARAVGTSKDTLGGAFFVTTSFFEPDALDAVTSETTGGLLSRNSKKSFVKLSRKRGYHLGLVEARDGEFHLSVPEL